MNNDNSIRESILDAAKTVFARYGFRKTTLDDIARAAGKGKSSLYYYFKNKEEIFEEMIDREITSLRNEFLSGLGSARTPKMKLRTYILMRMELFYTMMNYFPALLQEFGDYLSYIEKIRAKYDAEETTIIKSILQDGVESGQFSLPKIDLTAQAIIKAMKGFEFPWALEQDKGQLEKDIDAMLDVLFYGIIKR